MSRNLLCLAAIFLCLNSNSPLVADVVPKEPKQLDEAATNIVVGRITDLEITEEPGRSGFVDLVLLYTIEVLTVEKGQAHKPGDNIVVRARTWKERTRPYPGARGHYPLPAVEEEVRAYIAGGGSAVFPNGFATPRSLDGLTIDDFHVLQYEIKTTDKVEPLLVSGESEPPASVGMGRWTLLVAIGLSLVGVCSVIFLLIRRSRIT